MALKSLPVQTRDELPPFERFERETWVAVFLYVLGGWLGMHRYYLGRWRSGLLYTFTFGVAGLGWVSDGFELKEMLKEENDRLWLLYQSQPELFLSRAAKWAYPVPPGRAMLQALGHMVFFMIAPGVIAYTCIAHEYISPVLLLFFIMVLGYTGASVNTLRRMFPGILAIPGLGPILGRLLSFNDFYLEDPPRSIFYYIFYPIAAPVAVCFSRSARKEALFIFSWLGMMALGVSLELLLFHWGAFSSSLTLQDAKDLIFFELATLWMLYFCCIMPTVSIQQTLHHTGRAQIFAQIVVVAMLSFGVVIGLFKDMKTPRPTLSSFEWEMLKKKLAKPALQHEWAKLNRRWGVVQKKPRQRPLAATRPSTIGAAPPTSRHAKPSTSPASRPQQHLAQPTSRDTRITQDVHQLLQGTRRGKVFVAFYPEAEKTKAYQELLSEGLSALNEEEAACVRLYTIHFGKRFWTGIMVDSYFGRPIWLYVLQEKDRQIEHWKELPKELHIPMKQALRNVSYTGDITKAPTSPPTEETSNKPGLIKDVF